MSDKAVMLSIRPEWCDLISRIALRDALYDADAITMRGVDIINQFPAVDAEPVRTGRWVDCEPVYTNSGVKHNAKECSECGQRGFIDTEHGMYESDFCPSCGAKMDGKDGAE